eukprot:2189479-Prymnesium_polylepis.1
MLPSPIHARHASAQGLLVAQVLAHVRLVEGDHGLRLQLAHLCGRFRGRPKAERHVGHVEDDDSLVLRRVLCYPAQPRLRRGESGAAPAAMIVRRSRDRALPRCLHTAAARQEGGSAARNRNDCSAAGLSQTCAAAGRARSLVSPARRRSAARGGSRLELCKLRNVVEASDVQPELLGLGEFAECAPHPQQLITRQRGCKLDLPPPAAQ